jgi:hypothetical protein
MSTSSILKTSLAAAFLLGTTFLVASTAVRAQDEPVGELTSRADIEEELPADQAARAENQDQEVDPATLSRLELFDSRGKAYFADGVRDGFRCRARLVPVRRVYQRTARCDGGGGQGFYLHRQPGGMFPTQGSFQQQQFGGFDPGAWRSADEGEESFSNDESANRADMDDNADQNRALVVIDTTTGRPVDLGQTGARCQRVRVPVRVVYRKSITCGRY